MKRLKLFSYGMKSFIPADFGWLLGGIDFQVDHDRVLPAAHDHRFDGLFGAGVQLLVRDERRDVNKISRAGLGEVFEIFAPTKSSAAADDIQDRFELAMMMRSSLGVGGDHHGAGPQLFGSGARKVVG